MQRAQLQRDGAGKLGDVAMSRSHGAGQGHRIEIRPDTKEGVSSVLAMLSATCRAVGMIQAINHPPCA